MNYIKQLEQDKADMAARIANADKQITELMVYLNSSKFQCGSHLDGYVNVKDVIARAGNITIALHEGE
jgi:hypothetical protein